MTAQTYRRICSICEAGCGLEISAEGREVVAIRGVDSDVFSEGHVCAKGIALKELDADADRIRTPLVRGADGLQAASWDEAFKVIRDRLTAVRAAHGPQSVATYIGNPTAHNIGLASGMNAFLGALGSPHIYSAGTVDQVPKQLASQLMFGNDMAIPVPDVERCDVLVMLGANPVVSNGSLWMVPKVRERIRALQQRGGQLIVVDPRRSETARMADEHLAILPGGDAWLLIGLINELRRLGAQPSERLQLTGLETLMGALSDVSLAQASARSGLPAEIIRQLASTLHRADKPVLYGRIGTTVQRFGTLTSFLLEVVNLLVGALDEEGGAMFPEQPFHASRPEDAVKHGRYASRVSGLPEVLGQMPVAALAEEIDTPGEGQIRALFCFAGNPVVSTPDSDRLSRALRGLDLLVCVDIYHTETSRHADVILPGTSPFEECHYDSFLGSMGYKNVARFSPAIFPREEREEERPDEWQIGLTLGYVAAHGEVPDGRALAEFEDQVIAGHAGALVEDPDSGIHGADVQEIMARIEPDHGVERLLDLGIRAGRYGDHFGRQEGLTLASLAEAPDGIELGALRAGRLSEVMARGRAAVALAPKPILDDLHRLCEEEPENVGMRLIGRRNTRTNNSWLRNLPMLGKGRALCTLHMHPADARAAGLTDGADVTVRSSSGAIRVPLEISEAMRPGVVSLPHGFSGDDELAQRRLLIGANYNELVPSTDLDVLGSTSALNGVAVTVEPISP